MVFNNLNKTFSLQTCVYARLSLTCPTHPLPVLSLQHLIPSFEPLHHLQTRKPSSFYLWISSINCESRQGSLRKTHLSSANRLLLIFRSCCLGSRGIDMHWREYSVTCRYYVWDEWEIRVCVGFIDSWVTQNHTQALLFLRLKWQE